MDLNSLVGVIRRNLKQNSNAYISASACIGVVATAVLSARQGIKAHKALDEWEENNGISDNARERLVDQIRVTWRIYLPVVASGAGTIACIIAADRIGSKKTAAAVAQTIAGSQAFAAYKEKVKEQLGEKKHQEIMGKIAEDKTKENPPPGKDVVIAGSGHVLCCELYTGRYFNSDVETLKKAENRLNKKLLSQDFQTLADFQYMIGLTPTSNSNNIGWTSSRLLELEISAILTNDERPCLAFDYNYTVPV